MLPVFLFLLGGAALAGTMLDLNPDEDEDENFEEDQNLVHDVEGATSIFTTLTEQNADQELDQGDEYDENMEDDEIYSTLEEFSASIDEDEAESEEFDLEDPTQPVQTDILDDGFKPNFGFVVDEPLEYDDSRDEDLEGHQSITMDFDEIEIMSLPSPIEDIPENLNVDEFSTEEDGYIEFNLPEGLNGEILVKGANYVEAGESVVQEHTGYNVYFVPEGESFPETYEWSEDGASLFKTSGGLNDAADFGDIKLLARIDSGSWAFEFTDEGESITMFDDRLSVPNIVSNKLVNFQEYTV